jgi:formylglycine-generating enzyme required for sulfatase activity
MWRLNCASQALGLVFVTALATNLDANDKPAAPLGSCAAYAGSPEDGGTAGMARLPAGTYSMGSNRHRPEERYTHVVRLESFWIDRHEITNAQFSRFVAATGHATAAERGGDPKRHANIPKELLAPGSIAFIMPTDVKRGGKLTQWFHYVADANWRHPEGPGSSIEGRENHPVVHVSYEDALAYARWLGRSLPTEAQWEYAARGGREGEDDWGSAFDPDGKPIANTWQGIFPVVNTAEDGYVGTAPVGCFRPNDYGLYDMIGNVWEWTSGWYRHGHALQPAVEPQGPSLAEIGLLPGQLPSKVIKGGSFLCASNYCARYRPAARQPQEVDLGASHLGFRTVLNVSSQPLSACD